MVKLETLKDHQIIEFNNEISYRVDQSGTGYYLSSIKSGSNSIIFKFLKLNEKKEKICENVLGYFKRGDFPFCNTLEDLTKLTNYLIEEYNKFMNITKPETNLKLILW